jgi:hypothetical protein
MTPDLRTANAGERRQVTSPPTEVCFSGLKQTKWSFIHSTLSNVRVAVMVCPVREDVSGGVLIVRFFPLISK